MDLKTSYFQRLLSLGEPLEASLREAEPVGPRTLLVEETHEEVFSPELPPLESSSRARPSEAHALEKSVALEEPLEQVAETFFRAKDPSLEPEREFVTREILRESVWEEAPRPGLKIETKNEALWGPAALKARAEEPEVLEKQGWVRPSLAPEFFNEAFSLPEKESVPQSFSAPPSVKTDVTSETWHTREGAEGLTEIHHFTKEQLVFTPAQTHVLQQHIRVALAAAEKRHESTPPGVNRADTDGFLRLPPRASRPLWRGFTGRYGLPGRSK